MNGECNVAARCFVAEMNGQAVGFIGVIHFPHPTTNILKKIHRVVVLPDYQGIGIGKALINFVAEHYIALGFRMTITTSHPAINKSLRPPWRLMRAGKVASGLNPTADKAWARSNTRGRMTCSWEYAKGS